MEKPVEEWNVVWIEETITLSIEHCSDVMKHDRIFKLVNLAKVHLRFSLEQADSWQLSQRTSVDTHKAETVLTTVEDILKQYQGVTRPKCYANVTRAAIWWRQAQLYTKNPGATQSEVSALVSAAARTAREAVNLIKSSKNNDEKAKILKFAKFLEEEERNCPIRTVV